MYGLDGPISHSAINQCPLWTKSPRATTGASLRTRVDHIVPLTESPRETCDTGICFPLLHPFLLLPFLHPFLFQRQTTCDHHPFMCRRNTFLQPPPIPVPTAHDPRAATSPFSGGPRPAATSRSYSGCIPTLFQRRKPCGCPPLKSGLSNGDKKYPCTCRFGHPPYSPFLFTSHS